VTQHFRLVPLAQEIQGVRLAPEVQGVRLAPEVQEALAVPEVLQVRAHPSHQQDRAVPRLLAHPSHRQLQQVPEVQQVRLRPYHQRVPEPHWARARLEVQSLQQDPEDQPRLAVRPVRLHHARRVVLLLLEVRQDQQGQEAPVDRAGRAGLPRREDLAGRERLVVRQGLVAQQVLVLRRVLAPPAVALSTMPAELPIRGQPPSMLRAKLTPSWRRLPAGRACRDKDACKYNDGKNVRPYVKFRCNNRSDAADQSRDNRGQHSRKRHRPEVGGKSSLKAMKEDRRSQQIETAEAKEHSAGSAKLAAPGTPSLHNGS
jgi:hypothetical protein